MKNVFVAKTFAGVESALSEELLSLGALNCKILNRAVQFEGDITLMYKVCYFSRLSLRILLQIEDFIFENNNQFYDFLFNIPSENYLNYDGTLAVSSQLAENNTFKTPLFASMLAKDAICDRFRDLYNERPSVDKENPDVQFHIYIYKNHATVFLDASGESLHKRGYKQSSHPAPINEVLAAAMIKYSGWNAQCDFIDFMCGSGTILIEAAMLALNIPAGYYRKSYGFFSWKNFDRRAWNQIVNEAEILDDVNVEFYGSDISARFLGMAKANVYSAKLSDFIHLEKKNLTDTTPPKTPAWVIINPPYDERLEIDDLNALYAEIGTLLKHKYKNCKAFVISSDKEALKNIGLHASLKKTLFNGALECRFLGYDLY